MEIDPEKTRAAQAALAALSEHLLHTGKKGIYRLVSLEVDAAVLSTVLQHVNGNQTRASELLGISRTTLRAKLRAAGLVNDDEPLPV